MTCRVLFGLVATALVGALSGSAGSTIQTPHAAPPKPVEKQGWGAFGPDEVIVERKIVADVTTVVLHIQAYDDIIADARHCAAQEECSVAGGIKGCRCPVAVRASAKQRVDKAAQEASCPQVERLYCPPLKNPRCEKQMCVADQVTE